MLNNCYHIANYLGCYGDILRLSQWYMVSLVLNGTTGYIYLNGVQVATGQLFHPQNIIRQNNYFGRSQYSWDAKLDAILDDMELYNVALSASDINAKYQSALSKGIYTKINLALFNIL